MTPLTATAANPVLAAEPRSGSLPDASALSFLASLFAVSAGQVVPPAVPGAAHPQVTSAPPSVRSAPSPLSLGPPSGMIPAALPLTSLGKVEGHGTGSPPPTTPPSPDALGTVGALPTEGQGVRVGAAEAPRASATALLQVLADEPAVVPGLTAPATASVKTSARGEATDAIGPAGQPPCPAATPAVVPVSGAVVAARPESATPASGLATTEEQQPPAGVADAALGPATVPDTAQVPREPGLPVLSPPTPAVVPAPDDGAVVSRTTVPLLAAELVRAVDQGRDILTVALEPVELGWVEVALTLDADGRLRADFGVERPETLRLLQQDSRSLEQLLGGGGLQLADAGLSFSLRQDRGHERGDSAPSPTPPSPTGAAQPQKPARRGLPGARNPTGCSTSPCDGQ